MKRKQFWNHYIPKGESGGLIIRMPYVGHFSM